MNISTWSKGKKLLVMFLIIFFFIGVGVTVYLVQKQQETQSHAQKATVISLTPPNQSVAPAGDVQEDVTLNPGTNQVNFVKLVLKYDPGVFDDNSIAFNVDPNSPLKPVGDPVVSDGVATVTLQVGADPTHIIQSTTRLGSFGLAVNGDAPTGQTELAIDKTASQVRSVGGNDAFNENVLQNVANAQVTITGGQCVPNQSTCSWDASDGATSYHYVVVDTSQHNAPVTDGDTADTSTTFNSTPGDAYSCTVTANNQCGTSDSASGQNTCTATPTPTLTVTPTLTPTPTVTPTPGTTSTPTPTTPQTVTPTTPQTFVTATPIPTTLIAQGPTNTPAPTLPATGNPVVVGGIVGGLLFVLGGLALLFL